jgi:hypothetical protein
MDPVQPTSSDPLLDGALTPSRPHHLLPPHHPVLPPRKLSELAVVIARPQKPPFKDCFRGLGGHVPMVTRQRARVARASGRLCGL